jgi:hypothetical protein
MSARHPMRPGKPRTWIVQRIGRLRGATLGFVEAADEAAALAAAFIEFEIGEADRSRIVVRPIDA